MITKFSNEDRLGWSRAKIECVLEKVAGLAKISIENCDIKKAVSNVPKAGTPGFAPPEVFTGTVYPNSDLYSLGKTIIFVAFEWDYAFELLYGPVGNEKMNDQRKDAVQKLFEKFEFLKLVKPRFRTR